MRLADFIIENTEPILADWEEFARRIWPGAGTDPLELRDHAEDILRATAWDMKSDQSDAQRADKSKGVGRDTADSQRLNSASEQHGLGRVGSGFKLMELVAEYRALRASVVRLWRESIPSPDAYAFEDLTRFHESIDQSLGKAARSFTERVDRSRRLFLAILGHDLRNPLNAVTMSAAVLRRAAPADPEVPALAAQIAASADAMAGIVGDLLDFTAAGLGGGMPISRGAIDLEDVCRGVVNETLAAHPGCTVRYEAAGDLTGDWDPARLRQMLSNLLGNAIQHGAATRRIALTARGQGDEAIVAVHNDGPPIPPDAMSTIFDPLVRLSSPDVQKLRRPGSIGLGLYIAREIAVAHGGTIHATSHSETGTTFIVRLPRQLARR